MAEPHGDGSLAEVFFLKVQGAVLTQALVATARLGLADLLAEGPADLAALAEQSGAAPVPLSRLVDYLIGEGLFRRNLDGRIALTAMGRLLRREGPESQRNFVLLFGEDWFWQALGAAGPAVRDGRSGMEQAHGLPLFPFLQQHPDAERAYASALQSLSEPDAVAALAAAFPFDRAHTIVDLGGGTGATLVGLLRAAPRARGVLFDRPQLASAAQDLLESCGVVDRCEFVGGDFFETVPSGGDVYLLKWILVDWGDAQLVRLFRSVRRVLRPNSRLLIVSGLVGPEPSLLEQQTDLLTFLLPGGVRRNEDEVVALCAASGLRHVDTRPVQRHWLLEFQPDGGAPLSR